MGFHSPAWGKKVEMPSFGYIQKITTVEAGRTRHGPRLELSAVIGVHAGRLRATQPKRRE